MSVRPPAYPAVALVAAVILTGCTQRPTLESSAVAEAFTGHAIEEVVQKALPEAQRGRGGHGSASDEHSADVCRTRSEWKAEGLKIPAQSGEEVMGRVALGVRRLVTQSGGSVTAHVRCTPFDDPTSATGSHLDYTAPTPNQNAASVEGRVDVWLRRTSEARDALYETVTVELQEIVSTSGGK